VPCHVAVVLVTAGAALTPCAASFLHFCRRSRQRSVRLRRRSTCPARSWSSASVWRDHSLSTISHMVRTQSEEAVSFKVTVTRPAPWPTPGPTPRVQGPARSSTP
jgi:hypothetical protein